MTVLLILLCIFFEPRWQTNDDVAMVMAAGGSGLAATGTPNLVFSNVLWGYVVRLIPEVNGTSGYSLATFGVLLAVGTALAHGLVRLGTGYAAAISIVVLIMTRPILHPQFTINAGLLMVAAVMCWHLYARHEDRRALAIGCLFAFSSYLVRSLEFLLVLAVALPWLPWRVLSTHRAAKFAGIALAAAIAVAAAIDHRAYQTPEWAAFDQLDAARAPYTDFGAGARLKQRADILERHWYSNNDVDLIENWFLVDRDIANPATLNKMLGELGAVPTQEFALTHALTGMRIFWKSPLSPMFLAALLLAAIRPSWRTAAVWVLCIAAVLAMSAAGRPGVARVCLPLAGLLVVVPFFSTSPAIGTRNGIWRTRIAFTVVLVAALFNAFLVFSDSRRLQAAAEPKRKGLAEFPTYPVVVWGGAFPFQPVYPVLGRPLRDTRLYGLGVLTWAPYTVSYAEHGQGRGLLTLLATAEGVPIVARKKHFALLDEYCREHMHGKLDVVSIQPFGETGIHRVRCVSSG